MSLDELPREHTDSWCNDESECVTSGTGGYPSYCDYVDDEGFGCSGCGLSDTHCECTCHFDRECPPDCPDRQRIERWSCTVCGGMTFWERRNTMPEHDCPRRANDV